MNEKYSEERTVNCSATGTQVFQKLDYVLFRTMGNLIANKKLAGTFCSGYPKCSKTDCQLVAGKVGTAYSVPLND